MTTQSSQHRALDDATGAGAQVTPAAPQVQRKSFCWTAADASDAGCIAAALSIIRQAEHGDLIIDSAVALQHRAPELPDAWRFLRAAELLERVSPEFSRVAAKIAGRIGLATAGMVLTVGDLRLVSCGSSESLVLARRQPDRYELTDVGRAVLHAPYNPDLEQ